MKTLGELIDELDRRIDRYTQHILDTDRMPSICDQEKHRRAELVSLRNFLTEPEPR